MHNLFRLASYASLEGHFYKARMDRDLLQRYSKGIIATTGCPSGEVQTRLRLGQYDEALKAAGEFQEIFGERTTTWNSWTTTSRSRRGSTTT